MVWNRRKDAWIGYIFVAPFVLGFVVFMLWPFLHSFYLALTNYRFSPDYSFVGLDNFRDLLQDNRFKKSLRVTTEFVVLAVPLKLAFALMIAMLLNRGVKGLSMYRTIYYLPSIIGGSVAAAIMWIQIFGFKGLANSFLALFGIAPREWIYSPHTALYMLVLLVVWQFGSSMLIFLAGLKQVPSELYEAISIDGGGRFKRFTRITLPIISPVILFNLVMQTIGTFQVFTQGYIITKGGPLDETLFMVLYIYQQAFRNLYMGYAQAASWVLLAIIGVVTLANFVASRYWVFYSDGKGG